MAEFPVGIKLQAIDGASPVLDGISQKLNDVSKSAKRASGSAKDLSSGLGGAFKSLDAKVRKATDGISKRVFQIGSAAAVGGTALAIKEFAQFETGLVGVGKTTNISGKELKNLGKDFTAMSLRIPVATSKLLEIGQTAGQVGVSGKENILKFTDTIAKLGVASDLQGEEAASTLAKLLNITGEGSGEVDRLASTFVALGNKFPVTERGIARIATEVGRSTAEFKINSAQILGMSTALGSVGIQAELGGSVIGKSFRTIRDAISKGGKEFQVLQKIGKKSGLDIVGTFKKDAVKGFQTFLKALRIVGPKMGSISEVLAQLKLKGEGVNKVLPVLATRVDRFSDALVVANGESNKFDKGLENQSALAEESAAAFNTTASKLQLFANRTSKSLRIIGEKVSPGLIQLAEFALPKLEFAADEAGKAMERLFKRGELLPNLAKVAELAFNKIMGVERNRNQLIRDRDPVVIKMIARIDKTVMRLKKQGGEEDRINKLLKRRAEIMKTADTVAGPGASTQLEQASKFVEDPTIGGSGEESLKGISAIIGRKQDTTAETIHRQEKKIKIEIEGPPVKIREEGPPDPNVIFSTGFQGSGAL